MSRKIHTLALISILMMLPLSAASFSQDETDFIDQKMDDIDKGYPFNIDHYTSLAQSFIPRTSTITKIELYMYKLSSENFDDLSISVKKYIESEDMVKITISSEEIPLRYGMGWVEIEIPNIEVNPGEKYYIVCELEGTFGSYFWVESQANPYIFGEKWEKYEDTEWWKKENYDLAFKVYGNQKISNNPPSDPIITGVKKVKAGERYSYSIGSFDQEGDKIHYYIDWDEFNVTSYKYTWLIFCTPNVTQSTSNMWNKETWHVIRVKAVDEYGSESNYSSLILQTPKVYSLNIYSPIFRFFEWIRERILNS